MCMREEKRNGWMINGLNTEQRKTPLCDISYEEQFVLPFYPFPASSSSNAVGLVSENTMAEFERDFRSKPSYTLEHNQIKHQIL